MSMNTTPGPWEWKETGSGGNMPALYGSNGALVCGFGDDTQYYPTEGIPPNDADARLIAAAPEIRTKLAELLSLLEAVLTLPFPGSDREVRVEDEIVEVHALLARIDGKE